ncbi:PhzF family phenazine biosynthesis protein [Marinibactrum halimedae]|uniref:Isomerase n=1 Tax=Marinibactrum halimedae TaxID=1444977 RepID=A0AA37TCD7_9GAMM|nr:PhzF family phenazine biosynthesis protein [Marinibactrum halimedae]MCD9458542.1 PhzF family phenazine biosynthesis protein [Marinibactrum halimedae]GLS26592.1 putative isomerase [Marinibactrum halimedae]
MKLPIYQVDAFASKSFEGNPAAVCPLESWLSDATLQSIAEENNLSETAFFICEGEHYSLRWFTPEEEVDLCGHATLATAHVLFKHFDYQNDAITFSTRSGELVVTQSDSGYEMNFPATLPQVIEPPNTLLEAIGVSPTETLLAFDYIVVLENEEQVRKVEPNFLLMSKLDYRGVLITAPGESVDFVSRCFFPSLRVNEDPVTGSAHCELAPYWSQRLNKKHLIAQQLSQRTGMVGCEVRSDRVILTGSAVDYLQGTLSIEA